MDSKTDTKKQILDMAEDLLLDRGYNGFSYKDISNALKIKNASIHYYFPKKTDLGVAIIQRAINRFQRWAAAMESANNSYAKKLDEFCLALKSYLERKQRVCLGGALETDFKTLPKEMQNETRKFVSGSLTWLEKLLTEGKNKGEFKYPDSAKDQAVLIMASLQGAIQIVRVTTPSSFDSTVKQIKNYVCT